MYLNYAAIFLAVVVVFALVTARGRVHPFLALLAAAFAFNWGIGWSLSYVVKNVGLGFGQSLAGLGLIVVAGAVMAEIADGTGATARLQQMARGWRWRAPPLALLGLLGGMGSTPAAAFAVLDPLRRGIGGDSPRSALTLGLALSAAHGLLIPAPVVLASLTILRADWWLAVAVGLPAAILCVLFGVFFARLAASGEPNPPDTAAHIDGQILVAPGRGALALLVVSLVLVGLLIVQSLGDIASEPFGGGNDRHFILALGAPALLLAVGTVLLLLLSWNWEPGGLGENGWAGRALARAAPLLFILGAAAGLSKVVQETGTAEMVAEGLIGVVPTAGALALLLPFLIAAVIKTVQGSSLVAAITTAGMMMELAAPLGLGDPMGRTLAALAVGAGAMTVPQINDALFWLVTRAGRFSPAGALARLSFGVLLQGALALAVLIAVRIATA
ncbi:GntP family permease [Ancylobacter sp. TS-1]|uniref:GntT/GntP/DsdX family permease n=1 Tax=Ancylobacter sp. TS-1 TaxID=1850374 RepID=UPI001265CBF2|nr:GntP family permease [Ancylobacter sp. TS-1]QFR34807.1 GntP family permease [Ancylobacter sp. TS-1]